MQTPTYQQQFDKLTEAYIKNEIEPNLSCACFVGNLLNNTAEWGASRLCNFFKIDGRDCVIPEVTDFKYMASSINKVCKGLYSPQEIVDLEKLFLNTYYFHGGTMDDTVDDETIKEDALFIAFEKTLDLLKQIHQKNGEIIDTEPIFQKRKLATT